MARRAAASFALPALSLLFVLLIALALLATPTVSHGAPPDPRIAPEVWQAFGQSERVDLLLMVGEQPDLRPAAAMTDKAARGRWVYDTLRSAATQTQRPLVAELARLGVPYQRFWIVNAVRAQLTRPQLERVLAAAPAITHVIENRPFRMEPLPAADLDAQAVTAIEWGVSRVQAPWAWDQGYTGQGIVVAGQDTGYDWDHVALIRAYRGYNPALPASPDHTYNWHDAIHSDIPPSDSGNSCGYNSPAPCDDQSHGTHTMGTMIGNDMDPTDPTWPEGATNAIGVAPGAEWIGCRNMDNGWGLPSTYIECFEWLTAPYPPGGDPINDGDPTKAPDVINNSWGCPPSETCTGPEIEPALNAADAAGIVVVVSAGNAGPSCGTVVDPPAIYPRSFSVGATTSSDVLASFSSRGPATYNGQSYAKPNISAPGNSVRSSVPNNNYGSKSGTSMAGPHVAGVVALLLSAQPTLRGQTDLIKTILEQTADPKLTTDCGGDPDGHPNNSFGWGIVNARSAIESLAQPATLQGVITDALSGDPITGATVTLFALDDPVNPLDSGATDPGGAYSFSLSYGSYRVVIEKSGYASVDLAPIYIVGGRTATQSAALKPIPAAIADLQISIDGDDVLLRWTHQDSTVVRYEIWRALDQPYFTPTSAGAQKLAEVTPGAPSGELSYTDTASALSNPAEQGSYLVLGVNAVGQASLPEPRKGEFDFALAP